MVVSKIKKAFYSFSALALLTPVVASAQFRKPEDTNLPEGTLSGTVTNLMQWLLGIVGAIAVIGFAIAGIWYLTAAGDEGRIDTAKRAMTYSIIGVIVALLGLVILGAVDAWLSGTSTEF